MHSLMCTLKRMFLFSIAAMLLTTSNGLAQQTEPNAIVSLYQRARTAYSAKQFPQAAQLFRSAAEQSPNSALAIQCEYFAVMSEWAMEPCDDCAAKLSTWIGKAQKFQTDAIAARRAFDAKQLAKWTENAEIVHAKWDRQKLRFEQAENRLRSFLGTDTSENKNIKPSPNAWLELGSLLLEHSQDSAAARTCFENVMQCSNEADSAHCQATFGCALTCWHSQQYAEARGFLNRLSTLQVDDELKIQAQLLNVKIAEALSETIDVAKTLEPVVRIAVASNPSAATLYELAMALIEAGENSNSNEILLKLVHRFPDSPISIEARVRLARNASDKRQWKDVIEWSDQAIRMGCPKELQPYASMLRGQAKLELGSFENAMKDLEIALAGSSGDLQLEVSVRFQLAETLYQLQRWQDAETYWKWLLQTAESSGDHARKPDWYPVVLLRSAELLALRKDWKQAEEMVLRIRNDFPKCNRACEVDYLLARCLVSKADFDAVRQVLSSITQRVNSTPDELVARGYWMTGETFLMQRMYSEALVAYREVLNIPDQEYWKSASLLQMAQCFEATQDWQNAKEAYETIIGQFSNSPFVPTAKERLNIIPSNALANQQSKEQPLGIKR